jgi:hypothetical protein
MAVSVVALLWEVTGKTVKTVFAGGMGTTSG